MTDPAAPTAAPTTTPAPGSEPDAAPRSAAIEARLRASRRTLVALGLVAMLAMGGAARAHGIRDSPDGYHASRQLHSALLARSYYLNISRSSDDLERRLADRVRTHEDTPEVPVTEHVVAGLYWLTGGERLWMANGLTASAWLAGGVALFQILRRMVGTVGRFAGLAVYLFLPFAVQAGRSFQPDPVMVSMILASVLATVRHAERPTWRRLVIAGAVAGAAMVIKPMAFPLVVLVHAAVTIQRKGWLGGIKDAMAWTFLAIAVAPIAVITATGGSATNSEDYFVGSVLTEWSFYRGWFTILRLSIPVVVLLVGVFGLAAARRPGRAVALGLFLGYVAAAMAFDYRTVTHTYYHVDLVPVLGLGWAFTVDRLDELVRRRAPTMVLLSRAAVVAIVVVFGLLAVAHNPDRSAPDFASRDRAAARYVPRGARVACVTQTYGRELGYYSKLVTIELPSLADVQVLALKGGHVPTPEEVVRDAHVRYVVVTDVPGLVGNPSLKAVLDQYEVKAAGGTWVVFDLAHEATDA